MNDSLANWETIHRAIRVAHTAHVGQFYGSVPYTCHLADVAQVLHRFGITDAGLIATGWLHDILEQTCYGQRQLREEFGPLIELWVWALTDGEGKNRDEKKAPSYIRMKELPRSIVVKLADRIANIEAGIWEPNQGRTQMYIREQPEFGKQLFDVSLTVWAGVDMARIEKMWKHLGWLTKGRLEEAKAV